MGIDDTFEDQHTHLAAHGPTASRVRRRKRPRVPEDQRQRTVIACDNCRRLKEKCDGGLRCARCQRYGRECERSPSGTKHGQDKALGVTPQRLSNLEYIAKHFLGEAALADDTLQSIVGSLETGREHCERSNEQPQQERELAVDKADYTIKAISPNVAHYSGEFSHWSFSERIRHHVQRRLQESSAVTPGHENEVLEYWRANHLRSSEGTLRNITSDLPPKEIAHFLAKTYFAHAQTNTLFVEQPWVAERVDRLYGSQPYIFEEDAPWVCTTLLVLAVGTQFAHLENSTSNSQPSAEDPDREMAVESVGVSLYQMATRLIPDVLTIASIESVQAFLLLGHYVLPLDAQGLAYSYLGIATKVAIQNGMHRQDKCLDLDSSTRESRTSLWKTVSSLEKRVSILHGRPETVLPLELESSSPPDTLLNNNQVTMFQLTDWLGTISAAIQTIHDSPGQGKHASFENLFFTQQQYASWWRSLPDYTSLPSSPSRSMVHIHLSYHLNNVFLGRLFVFPHAKKPGTVSQDQLQTNPISNMRLGSRSLALAWEAVQSAQEIVGLCQKLHDTLGLARASYTEFSTCRAAVLTLLARKMEIVSSHDDGQNPHLELKRFLSQGIDLVRVMACANVSAQSEVSLLVSLDTAIKRLDAKRNTTDQQCATDVLGTTSRPYENFTSWALGMVGQSHLPSQETESSQSATATLDFSEWPCTADMWDGEAQSLLNVDDFFNFGV
ncbi:hypothetical protein Q7P37_001070 [Cladosporium fusiforme]